METDCIGKRIQQARDRKVLTRTELARMAGITYVAVYLIETGKRNPTRATVRTIAAALDVDAYFLVSGNTDTTPSASD